MSATTITPKQQSFVRSLLTERQAVLGIDDIDAYIREKGIDRLTGASASKVIEQLLTIAKPVNPEHAHLPQGHVIVNKRDGVCTKCNGEVLKFDGFAVAVNGGWKTFHKADECLPEPATLEAIEFGYYALPSATGNNDLDFFFVSKSREIRRVLGGHAPLRISTTEVKQVIKRLTALTEEQVRDAHILYGQEIGSCGLCGRSLTDEASRARGLGSDCASK